MILIMGGTATGKTTVVKNMCKNHGYHNIVTYTTRPQRPGEVNGVNYHYISDDDFTKKVSEGFFAEYKTYDTAFGKWHYGTALEDLKNSDDKTVIIVTPDGYKDMIALLKFKPLAIHISSNEETVYERLADRGDDHEEIERRILADKNDFRDINVLADFTVYNNKENSIENVVAAILQKAKNFE